MTESTTSNGAREAADCGRLFRSPLVPLPGSFYLLALYAGDMAMIRFRLEELVQRLASDEKTTGLLAEHTATDLAAETRRVIQCVIRDRLTPAIDDLLSFLVHPLDEEPGEVS